VPTAVRDCVLRNHSSKAVTVDCAPQFDGGLSQHFVLEATVAAGAAAGRIALRHVSSKPTFELTDDVTRATNGLPLSIVVYAVNPKGKSLPTMAGVVVLGDAERQAGESLHVNTVQ